MLIAGVIVALGGCAQVERILGRAPEQAAPAPAAQVAAPRTAETLDSTTEAERQAAVAAAETGAARELGRTVASLGAPGEPGLWLRTPLVREPARGRVDYPATGKSVAVDLIPLDAPEGAGSRLSLAAFRLIDAPLTELPELRVYRLAE